jgi:hypothetical protein
MKPRDTMVTVRIVRKKLQKLSADEGAAELERAQKVFLESHKRNDHLAEIRLKAKK